MLLGNPRQTLDVDYTTDLDQEQQHDLEEFMKSAAAPFRLDIESVQIDAFVPLPPGAETRRRLIGHFGNLDVYLYDLYTIALSKIARGFKRSYPLDGPFHLLPGKSIASRHARFDYLSEYCFRLRLDMAYLDPYLIHWPEVGMKLSETFRALNQLVREGRVRNSGVSDFNLKQLKQSVALCETPLLTNQVSYCIPDKKYVENGVLDYCQRNDVLLTAYSPVKRRYIKGSKICKPLPERGEPTPSTRPKTSALAIGC